MKMRYLQKKRGLCHGNINNFTDFSVVSEFEESDHDDKLMGETREYILLTCVL